MTDSHGLDVVWKNMPDGRTVKRIVDKARPVLKTFLKDAGACGQWVARWAGRQHGSSGAPLVRVGPLGVTDTALTITLQPGDNGTCFIAHVIPPPGLPLDGWHRRLSGEGSAVDLCQGGRIRSLQGFAQRMDNILLFLTALADERKKTNNLKELSDGVKEALNVESSVNLGTVSRVLQQKGFITKDWDLTPMGYAVIGEDPPVQEDPEPVEQGEHTEVDQKTKPDFGDFLAEVERWKILVDGHADRVLEAEKALKAARATVDETAEMLRLAREDMEKAAERVGELEAVADSEDFLYAAKNLQRFRDLVRGQ